MRAAISAIVMSVSESSDRIRPISEAEKKRPFPRIIVPLSAMYRSPEWGFSEILST
jgi:hypothetical protein